MAWKYVHSIRIQPLKIVYKTKYNSSPTEYDSRKDIVRVDTKGGKLPDDAVVTISEDIN